jgi:site-specific recombinase XerD
MNGLTFSQVIDGYLLAARARRLSDHTIADYQTTFRKFQAFLGTDQVFLDISKTQLEQFLAAQTVSKKTVLNYHTGLSALWTWAYAEGFAARNLMHDIERPKPEQRLVAPLSETEIRALLQAIGSSRSYRNRGAVTANTLQNQDRNRAIILLLLDTGIRADELCTMKNADLDLKGQLIKVFGKGDKERIVPICSKTAQALWRYTAARPGARPDEPLFLTREGNEFNRHRLLKQLQAIGNRAGVRNVHPHRFRHTFAISFLRNGGNGYALQMILGHTTMEMVRKYLNLAQADLENVHRLASPVANMRL